MEHRRLRPGDDQGTTFSLGTVSQRCDATVYPDPSEPGAKMPVSPWPEKQDKDGGKGVWRSADNDRLCPRGGSHSSRFFSRSHQYFNQTASIQEATLNSNKNNTREDLRWRGNRLASFLAARGSSRWAVGVRRSMSGEKRRRPNGVSETGH